MDFEQGDVSNGSELPAHDMVPLGTSVTDSNGRVWKAEAKAWALQSGRRQFGLLLNGRRSGIFVAVALVSVLAVIFLVPLVEGWWLQLAVFALCAAPFLVAVWISRRAIRRDSGDETGNP